MIRHRARPGPAWAVLALLSACATTALAAPEPPPQPASGPGGSDYPHRSVTKRRYGDGALSYWLFEPADPLPAAPVPLIVFNHGWGGTNPQHYGAWIEHLVRRGMVVVYPTYQDPQRFAHPPAEITGNAISAVAGAIAELQSGAGHARVNLEWFAAVGHSAGGMVTANLGALAARSGLPEPRALMVIEPGRSETRSPRVAIPLEDMSRIPGGTLLLVVAGEDDRLTKDVDAKKVFLGAVRVGPQNKDYVVLRTDEHGQPPLRASHFAPVAVNAAYDDGVRRERRTGQAGGGEGRGGLLRALLRRRVRARLEEARAASPDGADDEQDAMDVSQALELGPATVNAHDYYGLWKLFDGLTGAAFHGMDREYALGNTPQQRFMGVWSDRTPVTELFVTDSP